jgi:DNA invertase Pin-like site-specific DNA recombinase/uncharacterized coiled-coil protein SlyX
MEVMEESKVNLEEVRYCLYARKSSEADERQALSIDSQVSEMLKLAQKENMEIVETLQESKSAKSSGERVVYNQLLQGIREQRFNAILTWAPDRLSRNAGDLGSIVDLMDQKMLVQIRTHGQTFTDNPNEKFLLMILCSQAKLENDNRAKNVKRGLRRKCELGVRPGCVPLGYELIRGQIFQDPSIIQVDPVRGPLIQKMFRWVAEDGLSGRQVWEYMKEEGFKTKNGKTVTLSMIFRILADPFYYGSFEYPKGGGEWYEGTHEKLITKEVYDAVRSKMKVSPKGKWGRKDFFFNKIFKCGSCGSGISGEEKLNRHDKRYVYYRCNRFSGKNTCKEKYMREEKIIESLADICVTVQEQNQRLEAKLRGEVERFNDMQKMMNGGDAKLMTTKDYVQYVLKNGNGSEKSKIIKELSERLFLTEGCVQLG